VWNGTYSENVKVDKQLTLVGEGADVVTVTAAAANDRVFNVTANYVNLTGFNVTGATTGWRNAGVYLRGADHCNISDNIASDNDYGIYLDGSSDNTLTGNDCSGNGVWGFYSDETSHNNVVEDLTVASYPTTISFTYENGIAITGVGTPPLDPAGKANIGKYVNATNVTADSKLFLNVSYNESDLAGLDESSLLMWRHDGTAWSVVAGSGVNEAENYVYANITEFSVFAPMGLYPLNISKTDDVSSCVDPGDQITYTICYDNLANSVAVHNVTINDTLPAGVTFDSASPGWTYDSSTRNVTWDIGPVQAGAPERCVTLNVTVNTGTEGQTLTNCATIESDETEPAETCEDTQVCTAEPTPTPTPYPTPIYPPGYKSVPALTSLGMILLIGVLLVVGSVTLRRKR